MELERIQDPEEYELAEATYLDWIERDDDEDWEDEWNKCWVEDNDESDDGDPIVQEVARPKFCGACGAPVRNSEDKFCAACGKPLLG